MSKLRLCPSCEELSVSKAVLNTKKANWVKEFDYVQEFIQKTPLKEHKEYFFNIKKNIDIGKRNKGKMVLIWASEPGNPFNIKNNSIISNHFFPIFMSYRFKCIMPNCNNYC